MKRLPIAGASTATPRLDEGELRRVLSELGVSAAFRDADVRELYVKIAGIHGAWLAEQEAKEVEPVAKALLSTAKNLSDAAKLLSGHESGLRTHIEIEATSATARIMSHDPNLGSVAAAHEVIRVFTQEADRIGHACMVAYADLTRKDPMEDTKRLRWYDDFTVLLLEIAQKGRVNPTIGKDRISRQRTGWLFKAAQALERFLDPFMRSPSPEACGKRLERSRARLRKAKRQNPAGTEPHLSM